MPKALITGGAGFIGLQLCKKLMESGYEVHLLDNLQRGRSDAEFLDTLKSDQVSFIQLDLSQPGTLDELNLDYQIIFHFAAMLGVDRVLHAPFEVLRVNAASMQNMLIWAKQLPELERFVFSSTSEIYAGTRFHYDLPVPTPETVAIALEGLEKPRTSYALSKAYGEALLHASGLPFTILRFHNVYGPRMGFDHVIPQVIKKIMLSSKIEVPSAEHTRAFCFIEDAVEQSLAAGLSQKTLGETINIGNSREEIRIQELVQLIAHTMQVEIEIEPQPATAGSPDRRCPDTRKMKQLTGLEAKVSLAQGLQKCCDWYMPRYQAEG